MRNEKYAVFDWDNTVRYGFTLFDWINYLVTNKIVSGDIQRSIDDLSEQYANNCINHDEYAKYACRVYAKAIKNFRFDEIDQIVNAYLPYDEQHIFDGMEKIFDILYQNNVDAIIISGAPTVILNHYRDKYHLQAIYAFKERIVNGRISGQVAYNYGYNKQRIMELLKEKYQTIPLLAFGDSSSDIPLISQADYGFSLNSEILNATMIKTQSNSIGNEIISMIADIVKQHR